MIDELCLLEIPDNLKWYFDYEVFGRDVARNADSTFTDKGYIEGGRDSFTEHYSGRDDIPDEYRIFAYPDPSEKMPMKQQLEMYKQMSKTTQTADKQAPAREER